MTTPCPCSQPPFHFAAYAIRDLGEDAHGAEVAIWRCRACKRAWLHYSLEMPHYSQSGRWWCVAISTQQAASMQADAARDFIQQQAAGFAGGCFFRSSGHRITAPIVLA